MRKETSLFHNYGEFIEVPIKETVKPWEENSGGGIAEFGRAILQILNHYTVLNKQSILRCLQMKNRNMWKKEMLSKTLKSLRKSELIRMYKMSSRQQDEQALSIYTITEKGTEIIKRKSKENVDALVNNTQDCLDKLVLNQWHINLLYLLENRSVKSIYNQFIIRKGVAVPSFIRYEREIKVFDRKPTKNVLSLFAYVAPHKESDLETFFLKIIYNYEFLLVNQQYRPAMIVVLCENMNHASWISWKMNQIREMRPLNALIYALDIMTNKEQMLSLLYTCDADEEGMIRSNINLK